MAFLRKFTPDLYVKNIYAIPLDKLKAQGINTLFFDVDNTITPHSSPQADEAACLWFLSLKDAGFRPCLLSNNRGPRVKIIAAQLEVEYIPRAKKPTLKGFKHAFARFNCKAEHCALIGDQLFTDIFGGNRAKVFTVLVTPLGRDLVWGTRNLSRRLERLIWRKIMKNYYKANN